MAGPSNSVDLSGFLAALLGSMGAGSQGADFTQQFRRLLDPAFAGESVSSQGKAHNASAAKSGGRALEIQSASEGQPYIGMVDPRTENIRALEAAGLFPTIQSLLNPQWLSNNVLSGTGTAPTRAASNVGLEGAGAAANPLMQMIFAGSAGGAGTPWAPPGRGGTPGVPGAPPTGPGGPPAGPSGPPVGPPTTYGAGPGYVPGQTPYFPDPNAGRPPLTDPAAFAQPGGNPPTTLPANPAYTPQGSPNVPGGGLDTQGLDLNALFQTLIGAGAPMYDAAGKPTTDPTKATGIPDITRPYDQAGAIAASEALNPTRLPDVPPSGPQYNALGQSMVPGSDPNVYGPSGRPITFFGPRKGTEETAENWMQFRAGGGMMDPSKMTIVGEQGPEAIVPTQQGQQVVPLGGGGGGMDPAAMMQMMQLMMGGAKGMAQGGILPPPITDPNQPIFTNATANASTGLMDDSGTAGNLPPLGGNAGQFSPTQQPGALGQAAAFNPELDAFNALKTAIGTGWGSQANTAFNAGAGMLGAGGSAGDANSMRSLASGTSVTPEIQSALTGQLTQNPGQGVMNALQPVFNQNLQGAMGQLNASAPSIFNSAQQLQGADLGRSALNDFNLLSSQALQQGVGQQQNAASILGQLLGQNKQLNMQGFNQAGQLGQGNAAALGQLGQGAAGADMSTLQTLLGGAGQAGQGQFGRLNQAAQTGMGAQQQGEQSRQFNLQYDLAAQNQAYNQQMNPTLQLLLAAMGLSEPTGLQTVVGSQKA